MKTFAIISEYNPLHNGHIYHIQQTLLKKPDILACILSGNFTQRGDIAISNKHTRAKNAILAGADIVIELPSIYAVNCAELFAEGACKTLSLFDDVTLSFGTESGNLTQLKKISAILNNEDEQAKIIIKNALNKGESYVTARLKHLTANYRNVISQPNNILALEYIKASTKYNHSLHTIRRIGDYNSKSLDNGFASATAIRSAIESGDFSAIKNHIPEYSFQSLANFTFNDSLLDMILYNITTLSTTNLSNIYGISEGLENRIKSSAKISNSYFELTNNIKTKRYTMARIKRTLLYILFNLTKDTENLLINSPPYIRVLALKKGREDILTALSKNTNNLIVKSSDLKYTDSNITDSVLFDELTSNIYDIASKTQSQFNCIFVD